MAQAVSNQRLHAIDLAFACLPAGQMLNGLAWAEGLTQTGGGGQNVHGKYSLGRTSSPG